MSSLKIILLLIFGLAISRIFPHPDNFTPLAAMALFGGVHIRSWMAYVIPVVALLLSNFALSLMWQNFAWGFDSTFLIAGLMVVTTMIGRWITQPNGINVLICTLLSSVLFFVVTNFAVWLNSGMYESNLAGLIACFGLAIPFFQNTMIGDLVYSGILFGSYHWYILTQQRKYRII